MLAQNKQATLTEIPESLQSTAHPSNKGPPETAGPYMLFDTAHFSLKDNAFPLQTLFISRFFQWSSGNSTLGPQ